MTNKNSMMTNDGRVKKKNLGQGRVLKNKAKELS